MSPIQIRLGGYGPSETSHSRALLSIAERLRHDLGDAVQVEIDYNILDSGRPAHELLDDVEAGRVTAAYFSTSYLAARVPELAVIDLPYIFTSLEHAHRSLDGELGRILSERTRATTGLDPLGYWDNGFRHLTTRDRQVRRPSDCQGLRVRLQPNWAHQYFFEALGAIPVPTDLRDGMAMIKSGAVDAQENPLANFVAYGVDRVHHHLTLTAHAYGARGLYLSSRQSQSWPAGVRDAFASAVGAAILEQRMTAARDERELLVQLVAAGTRVVDPPPEELDAFRVLAGPVTERAKDELGGALLRLI
ncbi:MAG TPA: TRAP transporter substrate-binding protein [Candidatus Acidoferrales bacterium]|nr:TRAP transporter substrate-binding protein [Candidatus Acidoferrales bacterium]